MGKISSFLIKRKYIAEKYQFSKKKKLVTSLCALCAHLNMQCALSHSR